MEIKNSGRFTHLLRRAVWPMIVVKVSKMMPAKAIAASWNFVGSASSHLVFERVKGHSTLISIPSILPPKTCTKRA